MAIAALGNEPNGGLVVMTDSFTAVHRAPIISAAARYKVPAVYWSSNYVREGGLFLMGQISAIATVAPRLMPIASCVVQTRPTCRYDFQ